MTSSERHKNVERIIDVYKKFLDRGKDAQEKIRSGWSNYIRNFRFEK